MQAKVAIVSDKPQTTRKKILGIKTTERGQVIFFDCPGIHKPHFRLNELMMKEVRDALHDADLILYFVDIGDRRAGRVHLRPAARGRQKRLPGDQQDRQAEQGAGCWRRSRSYKDAFPWKEIVPISALKGDNLDLIEDADLPIPARGREFLPRRGNHAAGAELLRRRADPRKGPGPGRGRAALHHHPEGRGDHGPRRSGLRARRDLRRVDARRKRSSSARRAA